MHVLNLIFWGSTSEVSRSFFSSVLKCAALYNLGSYANCAQVHKHFSVENRFKLLST